MPLRILLGALLSAIVLMAWGFLFWTVLPPAKIVHRPLPNEDELLPLLKKSLPESGLYMYPMPHETGAKGTEQEKANDAWRQKHIDGPIVFLSYQIQGADPMSPKTLGIGFGHFFVVSLLAGILLACTSIGMDSYISRAGTTTSRPVIVIAPSLGLKSYVARVGFVTLLGIFAAVLIDAANPIWFHQGWEGAALLASFHVGCSLLMGLVLAALIRQTGNQPHVA